MARHFYAPLLVSGVEDLDAGTVELHVTSDQLDDCLGEVHWLLTTVSGETVSGGHIDVHIHARKNILVKTLDLHPHLGACGPRGLLLWLELVVNGALVSENLVLLARPKHLELGGGELRREPVERVGIREVGQGCYDVTLEAERPALWVWLELEGYEARFSDNFFHLRPGKPVEVRIEGGPDSVELLRQALRVRSLVDTYA
jgi:beta-mannosidase